MELVVLEFFNFDAHLGEFAVEELGLALGTVAGDVAVPECDLVQLLDVLNVVDREAFLEFFGKLFDVLSVTDGEHHSRYVVVFARC